MRNKNIILAIICALLVSFSGCGDSGMRSDYRNGTIEESFFDVSYEIPKQWTKKESNDNNIIYYYPVETDYGEMTPAIATFQYIEVNDAEAWSLGESYLLNLVADNMQAFENVSNSSKKESTLGDFQIVEMICDQTIESVSYSAHYFIMPLLHNGVMIYSYAISSKVEDTFSDDFKYIYDNIVLPELKPTPVPTETSTPEVTSTPMATPTSQPTSENTSLHKSGQYDLGEIAVTFSDSVRNDKTGKWKLSKVATASEITEYAANYYNTFFSSDDEIHAIINFSLNTTNKISMLSSDLMDITVYEYVDGEEHDAQKLFSGTLLKEYFVTLSSGEIEEIQ